MTGYGEINVSYLQAGCKNVGPICVEIPYISQNAALEPM